MGIGGGRSLALSVGPRLIENFGFNELANDWHAADFFRPDSNAIECFLLEAFLAYNLFHAFFALNLKPATRQGTTQVFRARLITAELHQEVTPRRQSPNDLGAASLGPASVVPSWALLSGSPGVVCPHPATNRILDPEKQCETPSSRSHTQSPTEHATLSALLGIRCGIAASRDRGLHETLPFDMGLSQLSVALGKRKGLKIGCAELRPVLRTRLSVPVLREGAQDESSADSLARIGVFSCRARFARGNERAGCDQGGRIHLEVISMATHHASRMRRRCSMGERRFCPPPAL